MNCHRSVQFFHLPSVDLPGTGNLDSPPASHSPPASQQSTLTKPKGKYQMQLGADSERSSQDSSTRAKDYIWDSCPSDFLPLLTLWKWILQVIVLVASPYHKCFWWIAHWEWVCSWLVFTQAGTWTLLSVYRLLYLLSCLCPGHRAHRALCVSCGHRPIQVLVVHWRCFRLFCLYSVIFGCTLFKLNSLVLSPGVRTLPRCFPFGLPPDAACMLY